MSSALSRVAHRQLTSLDPLVAESVELISRQRDATLPPGPVLTRWTRTMIIRLVRSVEQDRSAEEHGGLAMALISRDVACDAITGWVHLVAVRTWKSLLTYAHGPERSALLERADRFFSASQRIQERIARDGWARHPSGDLAAIRWRDRTVREGGGDYAVIVYPRASVHAETATGTYTRETPAPPRRVHRTPREIVEILPVSTSDTHESGSDVLNRARLAFRSAHPNTLAGLAIVASKDEVPKAFTSAREVLHTVHALSYRPGLYQMSDVALETLVRRSPDLAGQLAAQVYPVVDAGDYLVETVEAFLAHGTERKRLARRLYIHPNTLNYRLKRVYELTGLSLTTPRDVSVLRGGMISLRLLGHIGEPGEVPPPRTGGTR